MRHTRTARRCTKPCLPVSASFPRTTASSTSSIAAPRTTSKARDCLQRPAHQLRRRRAQGAPPEGHRAHRRRDHPRGLRRAAPHLRHPARPRRHQPPGLGPRRRHRLDRGSRRAACTCIASKSRRRSRSAFAQGHPRAGRADRPRRAAARRAQAAPRRSSKATQEIHRLENEGDDLLAEAIATLYDGVTEVPQLIKAMRWNDLYQLLEDTTDKAEGRRHGAQQHRAQECLS